MSRPGLAGMSGFTLVEVLAAMSAGIVLLYLLSETLALAQAGWLRAAAAAEATVQEHRLALTLRPLLEQMLPPTPDRSEHVVIAEADSLSFFTPPPQSRATQGVMRGRLAAEREADGHFALVLDLAAAKDTFAAGERRGRRVLIAGLAWAGISYLYAGADGLSGTPQQPGDLPELVLVQWRPTGSGADTRELAVRPRVGVSGRCHVDPTSGTCRAW